jgi:hypothetical protein
MSLREAKVHENAIAGILRYEPVEATHGFGIHVGRQFRGADEIGEHHRDLPTLGGTLTGGSNCGKRARRWRFSVCFATKGGDSVKQLPAVTNNTDTQILQVLPR